MRRVRRSRVANTVPDGDEVGKADPARRHYIFATRHELPIPEGGWTVLRHPPACLAEGSGCGGGSTTCEHATVGRFFATSGPSPAMAAAVHDMTEAVDGLIARKRRPVEIDDLGFTTLRPVIVVSAPWGGVGPAPDMHFDTCMALAVDAAERCSKRPAISLLRRLDSNYGPGIWSWTRTRQELEKSCSSVCLTTRTSGLLAQQPSRQNAPLSTSERHGLQTQSRPTKT